MTLGEAESMVRRRGVSAASAAERGREGMGEEESGEGRSETAARASRADLQAATRWPCFRHATFLIILSSDGPRMRPHRDGPPRETAAAAADIGGLRLKGWEI